MLYQNMQHITTSQKVLLAFDVVEAFISFGVGVTRCFKKSPSYPLIHIKNDNRDIIEVVMPIQKKASRYSIHKNEID
jgi:hypothetical protein